MMDGVEKGLLRLCPHLRGFSPCLERRWNHFHTWKEVQGKHVEVQTIPFETMQDPRVLSFTPPSLSFAPSLTTLSL